MANELGAPLDERRSAWIGRALRIEGRIVSQQNLTIDGRVDGAIEVGDFDLVIGAGAEVKANLSAKTVTISGTVIGNVTAGERLVLQPSASVEGDISAPRLAMADGATVKGKVDARGGR